MRRRDERKIGVGKRRGQMIESIWKKKSISTPFGTRISRAIMTCLIHVTVSIKRRGKKTFKKIRKLKLFLDVRFPVLSAKIRSITQFDNICQTWCSHDPAPPPFPRTKAKNSSERNLNSYLIPSLFILPYQFFSCDSLSGIGSACDTRGDRESQYEIELEEAKCNRKGLTSLFLT